MSKKLKNRVDNWGEKWYCMQAASKSAAGTGKTDSGSWKNGEESS